jgi:HK97 family phage major capsid protein
MELKEMKDELAKSNRALETMRQENEDNIKKHDVITDEKIARIKTDFAESEQKREDALTAAQAKTDALEKQIEELETQMNRSGTAGAAKTEADLELEIKAFNDWAHGLIKDDEYKEQTKAMSTNVATEGGMFIPTTTRAGIREQQFRSSPIRSLATVVNATIYEELVERGELGTAGTTESGTRAETTIDSFHLVTIETHERYAMPIVTNRLLKQSTYDIAGHLARKGGEKFGRDEASDFIIGDGSSKPRGFLDYAVATTADETRADFTLQYRVSGASGDFVADPNGADVFIRMQYDMQEMYYDNATWLMKNLTAAEVAILKDSNGDYLMNETVINEGVTVRTIQGRPVRLANDMPALAADSLSIALGDFSKYIVVDPEQMDTIIDPYTTKPHTKFHMTNMTGGGVVDWDAIKVMKFGTS